MQVFVIILKMMESYLAAENPLHTQLHFKGVDRWLEEQASLQLRGAKEIASLKQAKESLEEVTLRERASIEDQSKQYLYNLWATTGLSYRGTPPDELAHRVLYNRRTLQKCADSDAAFVKAVAAIAEAVANVNQARQVLFNLLFPE
jgi:hypothetical protein